jgi:hypothetical protein
MQGYLREVKNDRDTRDDEERFRVSREDRHYLLEFISDPRVLEEGQPREKPRPNEPAGSASDHKEK